MAEIIDVDNDPMINYNNNDIDTRGVAGQSGSVIELGPGNTYKARIGETIKAVNFKSKWLYLENVSYKARGAVMFHAGEKLTMTGPRNSSIAVSNNGGTFANYDLLPNPDEDSE